MALDIAQTSLFQKYVELYRNGDEKAIDALKVFGKDLPITTTSTGLIPYPSDFGFLQNVYVVENGEYNTVYEIFHSELEYYTTSKIDPLSPQNAKLIQDSNGIQIYPKNKLKCELHYLATPLTPSIGYTTDSDNNIFPNIGNGATFEVATIVTGGIITTLQPLNAGIGYTDGSFVNIPLIGGYGNGATVNLNISGGSVAITAFTGGIGYNVGDILTIQGNQELQFGQQFYVEIMNLALMYIGINLSQQELLQVIGGIK